MLPMFRNRTLHYTRYLLNQQVICCERFCANAKSLQSHYDVLGVKHNSNQKEIKDAFLELSKELHPDINRKDPGTHDKFVKLNEAYSVLGKPLSRREYDTALAYRIHYQQNISRYAYTSHAAGATNRPGPGTGQAWYDRDEQQEEFWDETIWHMRDKSKDKYAYYDDDNYYGIKGVRRVPNSYIVGGCFVLLGFGCVIFYLANVWSGNIRKRMLEESNRKNYHYLQSVKDRAKENGTAKQLDLLTARLSGSNRDGKTD